MQPIFPIESVGVLLKKIITAVKYEFIEVLEHMYLKFEFDFMRKTVKKVNVVPWASLYLIF